MKQREPRDWGALWVGGDGMWLEETAGPALAGRDAAAGGRHREHTCHSVTLFSLLASMW